MMLRLCLPFLCFGVGSCSLSDGLSRVPVASGIVQHLKEVFPAEPMMAVEKAAADGLTRALGDEGIGLSEIVCNRDYAQLCPQGWADTGDGNTCAAPRSYQGTCPPQVQMGGMTAIQKMQQASKCGALYACLGSCTPDLSRTCPLGWLEDVSHDCLAPAGYTGRCVGRKNFNGMRRSEKDRWARECHVTWPCRSKNGDAKEVDRISVSGVFNTECVTDYSKACPDRYVLKGGFCQAPSDVPGRCGFTLSSQYNAREKVAYAEACLTPWPCGGVIIG